MVQVERETLNVAELLEVVTSTIQNMPNDIWYPSKFLTTEQVESLVSEGYVTLNETKDRMYITEFGYGALLFGSVGSEQIGMYL